MICDGRSRQVLGDEEDLLADLGLLLEPLLEVGLGAVGLGGVEAADALGEGEPEDPVRPAPRPVPASRIVMSMPVLPRGRLGIVSGLAGASWLAPSAEVARLTAEAVARAPAWRNVRRSVLFDASWAMASVPALRGVGLNSAHGENPTRSPPGFPRPRCAAFPA